MIRYSFSLSTILLLATTAPAFAQSWTYSRDTDQFTDKIVSTAIVRSGGKSLIAKCNDSQLDMYVSMGEFLSNRGINFKFRIDKQPTVETGGPPSDDGTAVFFNFPGTYLRSFLQGTSIIFEVDDYRGVGHRATFPLSRSKDAITKIMQDCSTRVQVPSGIDDDIIRGVDDWSSEFIPLGKQALIDSKLYKGSVDNMKDDDLYRSMQQAKGLYIIYCGKNTYSDLDTCSSYVDSQYGKDKSLSTYDIVYFAALSETQRRIKQYWLRH